MRRLATMGMTMVVVTHELGFRARSWRSQRFYGRWPNCGDRGDADFLIRAVIRVLRNFMRISTVTPSFNARSVTYDWGLVWDNRDMFWWGLVTALQVSVRCSIFSPWFLA